MVKRLGSVLKCSLCGFVKKAFLFPPVRLFERPFLPDGVMIYQGIVPGGHINPV